MIAAGLPTTEAAVVDIGSNSVRMVLYRIEGRAVWTVFNEKVLAGLGRDLAATGRLSPQGVTAARAALRRFAAVIDGVKPERVLVAATAAVREAQDGAEFCAAVAAESGLNIRVLSGEEEARHAALGVLAGAPSARGVAADLGGASLELTRLDGAGPGLGVTLPLGPFSLASAKGFDADRLRQTIARRLKPAADAYASDTLHAVGGAWRSLAQLHMALTDYPLQIVHQYALSARDARDLARFVAKQSKATLDKTPGVTRKRAETLPYAALVLEGLIERLNLKRVVFSAWGVREGLLFETLRDVEGPDDPLLAGAEALGARQNVSPSLWKALPDWIAPVMTAAPEAFGPERDAVMTQAVARLADLGARLHADHRIELVFEQILRAPVPGQTHAERAFLATALNARYGGDAATPQPALVERLLTSEQRARARILGLAVRLGCDLSGRSTELLANARLSVGKDAVTVSASEGYADLLLGEQARRRARALAEAMGRELRL